MDELHQNAILWYNNEFKATSLYQDMVNTVEESPWHRERNVGVHTDMVVSEFIARSPLPWSKIDVIGFLACVFHDVGKPAAMEIVYKPERGHYKRFRGHEKISARMFEDWAAQNMPTIHKLHLYATDIHKIAFLIEHHLPWDVVKEEKRRALAFTVTYIEESCYEQICEPKILERILLSDTYGRISDDAETKKAKAHIWTEEFLNFRKSLIDEYSEKYSLYAPNRAELVGMPTVYMAIGAPGSGKSTFRQQYFSEAVVHSMDTLRHEWYDAENYARAFELSTQDKDFSNKVQKHFVECLKTGKTVFVDNTNSSSKQRRRYILEAKKKGYRVVAILFPIALQTCIDRQQTRTDKSVPESAVQNIWNAISMPMIGEFDDIAIITSNLNLVE